MDDFQRKYLAEVGRRIQHEGFTVCEEKDGLISVEWAGSHLCTVNGNGGVLYERQPLLLVCREQAPVSLLPAS